MNRLLAVAAVLPLAVTAVPASASPPHYLTTKVYGARVAGSGAYAAACYTQASAPAMSIVLTCTIGDLSQTTKGAGHVLVSAVAGLPGVVPTQACGRVTATMLVSGEMGPMSVTQTQTSCVPLLAN